jgi:hypothetical protein
VYSNGSEWLLKYIVCEPWVFLLQGVLEAARPKEGFYIRSGITIILKNTTIMPGTVI